MRSMVSWGLCLGLSAACFHSAGAQSRDLVKPRVAALTVQAHIDIINAVLIGRQHLFGQTVIIDGCALSLAIDVGNEDIAGKISPAFRSQMRGQPPSNCMGRFADTSSRDLVVLDFLEFRREHGEGVLGASSRPQRPKEVVVLELRATNPVSQISRVEQWVMDRVSSATWVVLTLRVFGIVSS